MPIECPFQVVKGDLVLFDAVHDEQNIALYNFRKSDLTYKVVAPCIDVSHEFEVAKIYSPDRVCELCDDGRNRNLTIALENAYKKFEEVGSAFVDLSSDGYLAALASLKFKSADRVPFNMFYHVQLGSNMVWHKLCGSWFQVVQPSDKFMELFAALNKVSCNSVVMMSDLYYSAIQLQTMLGALNFFYQMRCIHKLSSLQRIRILDMIPGSAIIRGALISAPELRTSQACLNKVEGFDHEEFDLIWALEDEHGSNCMDYGLWNYTFKLQSEPFIIDKLDFVSNTRMLESNVVRTVLVRKTGEYPADAIVVWIDLYSSSSSTGNTRLLWSCYPGLRWYYKQKVYFLHDVNLRTSKTLKILASQGKSVAEIKLDAQCV